MADELELDDDIVFEKDGDLKETESKIGDLLKTKERTVEQEEELKQLKTKRQDRYNERLREINNDKKAARLEAQRERERAEKLEKELEEARKGRAVERPQTGSREQLNINGKNFYTDRALGSMVQAGEMTQDEAWQHQQERIEEKAVARLKSERQQDDFKSAQEKDIEWVLGKYPKFNPRHPNHNSNDPIYKEANRLIANGYRSLKLAVEEAEERVGKNSRPDLSEELSVTQTGSGPVVNKSKTVDLTENEMDQAERFYRLGGKINPVTNKVYTRAEAIQKAMKVKQDRASVVKR